MHLTPQRENYLKLKDGRRLAWHEWGPESGRAVLFCTGAGMSGSLGFGAVLLDLLQLKLISPDRPGLGNSDPHSQRTLLSWCDDVAQCLRVSKLKIHFASAFLKARPSHMHWPAVEY